MLLIAAQQRSNSSMKEGKGVSKKNGAFFVLLLDRSKIVVNGFNFFTHWMVSWSSRRPCEALAINSLGSSVNRAPRVVWKG